MFEIYVLPNDYFNYENITSAFVTIRLLSLNIKSLNSKISPRDYKKCLIK